MVAQAELYRFVEANGGAVTTYTSHDEAIVYDAGDGNETYTPVHIVRSEVEQRRELGRANLEIKLPLDDAVGSVWVQNLGELFVSLTIFRRDTAGTVNTIWKGRMSGIIPNMDRINMNFESVFTSLRRPGVRARFQRSCRHALYGRGCTLDPADFETACQVSARTSTVITVPEASGQPDGYWIGGMFKDPSGVYSYIIGHSGTSITLQRLSYALETAIAGGLPVAGCSIYPGCDHSRATCHSKFNNRLNYGGFDWIPEKNPSGGSSIV